MTATQYDMSNIMLMELLRSLGYSKAEMTKYLADNVGISPFMEQYLKDMPDFPGASKGSFTYDPNYDYTKDGQDKLLGTKLTNAEEFYNYNQAKQENPDLPGFEKWKRDQTGKSYLQYQPSTRMTERMLSSSESPANWMTPEQFPNLYYDPQENLFKTPTLSHAFNTPREEELAYILSRQAPENVIFQGGQQMNPFPNSAEKKPVGTAAKGGKTGSIANLVGEKGPELHVTNDGKQNMVGENGPEIFNSPMAGQIIPNNQLPPQMQQGVGPQDNTGMESGSVGPDNSVQSVLNSIANALMQPAMTLMGQGRAEGGEVGTSPTWNYDTTKNTWNTLGKGTEDYGDLANYNPSLSQWSMAAQTDSGTSPGDTWNWNKSYNQWVPQGGTFGSTADWAVRKSLNNQQAKTASTGGLNIGDILQQISNAQPSYTYSPEDFQSTYTYNPDEITQNWQEAYYDPAMQTFQQDTVPYLREAALASGNLLGEETPKYISRQARALTTELQAERAKMLQEGRTLEAQALQDLENRRLQGMQMGATAQENLLSRQMQIPGLLMQAQSQPLNLATQAAQLQLLLKQLKDYGKGNSNYTGGTSGYSSSLGSIPQLLQSYLGSSGSLIPIDSIVSMGSGGGGSSTAETLGSIGSMMAGLGMLFSDRRLKKNIRYLAGPLATWTWNERAEGLGLRGMGIGLIAQDVEQYRPDVVSVSSSGYKQINYALL